MPPQSDRSGGGRGAGAEPRRSTEPPPPPATLDNTTKSASARVDESTGELLPEHDPTLKWQLQAVARLALVNHRIHVCMRHLRSDKREVQVRRSEKSSRPYYAGLMACGSVWTCPVCAPKIQAVRALEVRSAIDQWTAQGGSVVLLTQTVPHSRHDVLEVLLGRFTDALRRFKGRRAYTRASERFGISGSIRALEVTHGAHGWHPHAHTILFVEGLHDQGAVHLRREMKAELFKLWESAAVAAGFDQQLSPDAFDVQDASKVKNYVTKLGTEYQWSAEHELVKAHSKRGSSHSLTPFDMLRRYLEAPDDGRLLALFAEYAYTFHGKRQLVWSDGLKKRLLGTEGLTDEQVAASIGESDEVLARIPFTDWKLIRRHNLQGHVLQVVNLYGAVGLQRLLDSYRVPSLTQGYSYD